MSGEEKRVRKAAPDRTVTRGGEVVALGSYAPPHSLELESRVLGYLIDPIIADAWPLADSVKIRVKSFYLPANQVVFSTLSDMRRRGMVIEVATLMDELKLAGKFEQVGGWTHLKTLVGGATSFGLRQDLERLRLLWELRNTLELCADMRQAVVGFESREKFAEQLSGIGQRLIRYGRQEASMTMQEHIAEVEADFERRITGTEDRSRWVFTGLPTFDKRLRPLNSAKLDGLVVIGGGSGHGKSALMRQLAWQLLKHGGGSVLFYTLETDLESLIEQMVSTVAEIDLEEIQEYAGLYPERAEKFRAECRWLREEVAGKRLWMVQHGEGTDMSTIEDLEAHYRAHANLHGHPTMVVVDYLQILETKKRTQSREQTVATVSHGLKRLKLEAGNCWLVGAQLNESGLASMREPKRDENKRIIKHNVPGPGALRESQAIYHDADRVIMLYCPPEDCRGNDNWGPNTLHPEIWLCQIKRKKGATGIVKCWFKKRITLFQELSRTEVIEGEGGNAAPGATPAGGGGGRETGQPSRPRGKAEFLARQQQQRKEGR